ncbi:MAG: HD domain-containing protein [Verrucomicrobia bacterium]|nr:HD domain-containing protein [Verrucomicrobiota bacterium]
MPPMSESVISLRESKTSPVGTRFLAICSVGEVSTKPTKNGSSYFEFIIADASDDMKVRVFADSPIKPVLTTLKSGTPVRIGGVVGEFNGRPELKPDVLTPLTDAEKSDPAIMGRLTPISQFDPVKMWEDLMAIVSRIPHASLRATVESVFAEHGERFCESVAAMGMHHAYRHGLLEHTLRMAQCAEALLPLYPRVDVALTLAGTILHDIGKIQEYTRLEAGMSRAGFTRAGNLHGHLVLGAFIVREHAAKVGLDVSLRERLEHILLSHHTMREYGACQTPSTPEAVFVARLDDMDAKLSAIEEELRKAPQGLEFTPLRAIDGQLLLTPPKTR